MSRVKIIYIFLAIFLLAGCASSRITTSWKGQNTLPKTFSKIMIVSVVKTTDTALRRSLETNFANDLKALDYNAVSALEEYGPKGLSDLTQEATYSKLCNRGIDAIITITLLDKTKEKQESHNKARFYETNYFFNHIWNYRNTQADLTDTSEYFNEKNDLILESILFDLQTFQPLYVIQTKPFNRHAFYNMQQGYGAAVIEKMLKEKVIKKQPKNISTAIKAL